MSFKDFLFLGGGHLNIVRVHLSMLYKIVCSFSYTDTITNLHPTPGQIGHEYASNKLHTSTKKCKLFLVILPFFFGCCTFRMSCRMT